MDHILRKMQMFCFSDHTRIHLHPTWLGPMDAAANGWNGAKAVTQDPLLAAPREKPNYHVEMPAGQRGCTGR
jgi:hypothetical protein